MTTTLILGAGFGGISCARTVRERLPAEHRVVVVDRDPDFVIGATKTWVALGMREAAQVRRDRTGLLPEGVDWRRAEVTALDAGRRRVETTAGTLEADHLVIALGADLDPGAVPGLAEAQTFYSLEGASRLRTALESFDGGRLLILVARPPFKCPPAPYEAALLFEAYLRERGLRSRSEIELWTAEPAPMPTAGPEMGRTIAAELAKHGIGFHPGRAVRSADLPGSRLDFGDGAEVGFDLLVVVPPHRVPRVVAEAGLSDASGWIPVDPATLEVRAPGVASHVYAVGDVTRLPLPGRYRPDNPLVLPKAGVFAAAQGEVVGRRVAAAALGGEDPSRFAGEGFCYLEVGEGRAIRAEGSFFDLPHPHMQAHPPSEAQYRDKLEWVERWSAASP